MQYESPSSDIALGGRQSWDASISLALPFLTGECVLVTNQTSRRLLSMFWTLRPGDRIEDAGFELPEV